MTQNRGNTLKEKLTQSEGGKFLWNQEAAILDTTNLICELMDEEGVSRADLARRLGKTKGYITQLLDGSTNMTIRTVADVFTSLGHEFRPSCKAREDASAFAHLMSVNVKVLIPHSKVNQKPIRFSENAPRIVQEPSGAVFPIGKSQEYAKMIG